MTADRTLGSTHTQRVGGDSGHETGAEIDRVLVAGATGKTGRHVLDVLQERGYEPRAITRSADRANLLKSVGIDAVAGNLLVDRDVRRAVRPVDAVITCVGTPPMHVLRARIPGRESGPFVDGVGNERLVQAADEAGIRTLVMCSSLGVGGDRASWMASLFGVAVGPVLEAKTGAEAAVREADLRHTILRPGILLDVLSPLSVGPLRTASAGTGVWGSIPRRTLAELLVGALSTPAAVDETLEVARSPVGTPATTEFPWDLPD